MKYIFPEEYGNWVQEIVSLVEVEPTSLSLPVSSKEKRGKQQSVEKCSGTFLKQS